MAKSRNEQNIEVFEDTEKRIKENCKLGEAASKSSLLTVCYNTVPDFYLSAKNCKVTVSKSKTFDAARKYTGNTAVLNFASATTPGGGVRKGSSAQEECLCRVSTLLHAIETLYCWDEFYTPNRKNGDNIHTDSLLYTPKVCVFKTDDYEMLPETEWKYIDVITCAAPNLKEVPVNEYNAETDKVKRLTSEELFDVHYNRARAIMGAAAFNGADNIILGAFGCGVFKNDPRIVATAWKKAVDELKGCFDNIEFAVYCGKDDTNYQVFNTVFNA